jgi:hypothetical protein
VNWADDSIYPVSDYENAAIDNINNSVDLPVHRLFLKQLVSQQQKYAKSANFPKH